MARSHFTTRSALILPFALLAAGQASIGTGISVSSITGIYTNSTTISTTQSSSTSISIPLGTGSSSSSHFSSTSSSSSSVPLATSITSPTIVSNSSSVSSSTSSSAPLGTGISSSTSSDSSLSSSSSTLVPGAVTSPPPVTDVSTNIDGTPTVVPVISGGDITTPIVLTPTTTIAPTGTEASSSKSAVETQLSSVFPIIQSWIDNDTEDTGPIISSLEDVEDDVEDILSKIEGDSDTDSTQGCTQSLFSLLTCIITDVTKIKTSITSNLLDDVTNTLTDLTNLTNELENEQDDDDDKTSSSSSGTSSSTTSSSTTCTSGTSITEEYFVTCTPTVASSSITTEVCETSTSTITGCSVTATTTTTTVSSETRSPCAQTGCSSCTETVVPTPTAECSDCTTIDGVAYPPQATALPEGAEEITDPNSIPSANGTTSTKRKRTLPTPDEYETGGASWPYQAFFQAQLATPGLINVPHRLGGTGGSSSALLREFESDSRLTMTVQGLYGCTSLILISRKGVYMSHMFENPGFMKGYDDEGNIIEGDFANDIEYAIPNGDTTPISGGFPQDGEPWLPNLNALSGSGKVLDPNQEGGVRAIIVTPSPYAFQTGTYRYPDQVNSIREWVKETFDYTPSDYVYTATDNQLSNDQEWADGKVLFQFDPAESTVFDKFPLGGQQFTCPIQYAGLKLWVGYQEFLGNEYDAWYEDSWAFQVGKTIQPLPLGQGTIVSRDDVPNACVLNESKESSSTSSSATETTTASATSTSDSSVLTTGVPSTFSTITTTSSTYSRSVISTTSVASTSSDISTTSEIPTTTSSSPTTTYTGSCYTDTSREEYGQCQWTGDSGIVQVGGCPESAACPSNDAPCYFIVGDDAYCGSGSLPTGSSTATSSAPAATNSSASECNVPSGCENVAAPDGCAILCS